MRSGKANFLGHHAVDRDARVVVVDVLGVEHVPEGSLPAREHPDGVGLALDLERNTVLLDGDDPGLVVDDRGSAIRDVRYHVHLAYLLVSRNGDSTEFPGRVSPPKSAENTASRDDRTEYEFVLRAIFHLDLAHHKRERIRVILQPDRHLLGGVGHFEEHVDRIGIGCRLDD